MCLTSSLLGVICAVVFCLQLTSSLPTLDQHQKELKEHYEHLAYIAGFTCHVPQPRAIPVHKLFSDSDTYGKAYFPDVTVLHRCSCETGSCTSGYTCSPEHMDSVSLPFKVTFLEDIEHHRKGSWLMEYHLLDNHTQCACISESANEISSQYQIPPDTQRSEVKSTI